MSPLLRRQRRALPLSAAALSLAALLLPGLVPAASAETTSGTLLPRVPGTETQGVIGAGGAWCWFSDPRSVHAPGPAPKTFTTWIDSAGSLVVSSYDHTTKRLQTATLRTYFVVDDHNNPSLLLHPNGRLSVFWSGHNGDAILVRTTLRPGDITAFGATRRITSFVGTDRVVTYTNPVRLPGESGRIYLFFRSGYSHQGYVTSDDEGATWSAAKEAVRNGRNRPYVKYAGDGDRDIALAFTDGHPDEVKSSVYYARYRGGALHRADGTVLGPLAAGIDAEQGDLLWDATAQGASGWVHDVALGKDGLPVVVFATIRSPLDHRYHYARHDGTQWRVQELATAGRSIDTDGKEPSYSAGITLDHEDPSRIYLARPSLDPAIAEIERWKTSDAGTTWVAEAITQGSTRTNVRPVRPRGLPDGTSMEAVWMHGAYPHFTTFRTSLLGTAALAPGVAHPTTTRISASALSVTPGGRVRIGGRLIDTALGRAVADREVVLLSRRAGLTRWTHLAERRTDSTGLVTFSPYPSGTTEYAVLWPGNADLKRSSSPVVRVASTRTPTTLRISAPTTARIGSHLSVAGRLVRSSDGAHLGGRPIVLRVRRAGTTAWTTVAESLTRSDGLVVFRPRLWASTDYVLQFAGTTTHAPSTSPVRRVLRR